MPEDEYDNSKKAHVKRKSGKKAEKKKGKEGHEQVRLILSFITPAKSSCFSLGNDCKTAQPEGICGAEHHKDGTKSEEERRHQREKSSPAHCG